MFLHEWGSEVIRILRFRLQVSIGPLAFLSYLAQACGFFCDLACLRLVLDNLIVHLGIVFLSTLDYSGHSGFRNLDTSIEEWIFLLVKVFRLLLASPALLSLFLFNVFDHFFLLYSSDLINDCLNLI